jgi:hypothetical protein
VSVIAEYFANITPRISFVMGQLIWSCRHQVAVFIAAGKLRPLQLKPLPACRETLAQPAAPTVNSYRQNCRAG